MWSCKDSERFCGVLFLNVEMNFACEVSQSVSYFTVPPRAHPSTGSQSGSATPGLCSITSTEYSLPGATQLSQVRSISPSGQ